MNQRSIKPSARAGMPALSKDLMNALDWMWEDIEELKKTERPPPMEVAGESIADDSITAALASLTAISTDNEVNDLMRSLTILTSGTAQYVSVKRDFLVRLLEFYRRLET